MKNMVFLSEILANLEPIFFSPFFFHFWTSTVHCYVTNNQLHNEPDSLCFDEEINRYSTNYIDCLKHNLNGLKMIKPKVYRYIIN